MAVLVVAAEARELSGLRGYAGARGWMLVANGAGPKLAGEAVRIAMEGENIDSMVSVGYCGALDPALAPGAVIVATQVRGEETWPCSQPSAAGPCATGAVFSTDRFIGTVAEKRRLREETGASAVEMEAAAVAREAHRHGLPFYCVKVVTDTAGEEFRLDLNAMRDDAGRFDRGRILRAALRQPRAIPELIQLDARCRRASKILGDFLAGCRF